METKVHQIAISGAHSGQRLDAALAARLPDYSRTSIKHWIESGNVVLNEQLCVRPRTVVYAGDRIELTARVAANDQLIGEALDFDIAYEDEYLLVVNKPAGLVVHPGAGNLSGTLVNGLVHRFPDLHALPRAGLIHRLDQATSGLLLVARTSAVYQQLVARMAAREIHRRYCAVVQGLVISSGTVEAPIARDRVQRTKMRVTNAGRMAVTHYQIQRRFRAHTQLELTLETGRTHQIRVHMQYLGFPLLGDPSYGTRRQPPPNSTPAFVRTLTSFTRQALHARRLRFAHPVTNRVITVHSTLPADMQQLLRALRNDARRAPHA